VEVGGGVASLLSLRISRAGRRREGRARTWLPRAYGVSTCIVYRGTFAAVMCVCAAGSGVFHRETR